MKTFLLFGSVLAQECEKPNLGRDDLELLCNDQFCQVNCKLESKPEKEVYIRCWCKDENCKYIRHYTRYEENMHFELETDWLDDFKCQSLTRSLIAERELFEPVEVEGSIIR